MIYLHRVGVDKVLPRELDRSVLVNTDEPVNISTK